MTTDWIPVDQQMPPEQWVLICVLRYGYRKPDINMAAWYEDRQEWRTRAGVKVQGTITHWMLLPELPCNDRNVPEPEQAALWTS